MKSINLSKEKIESLLNKRNKKAKKIISDSYKTRKLVLGLRDKISNTKIFQEYSDHLRSMCNLVSDYALKEYTDISTKSVLIIVSALIYILSPLDLIPDIIPMMGYLDDIAVIAYALRTIRVELVKYNVWRNEQNRTTF